MYTQRIKRFAEIRETFDFCGKTLANNFGCRNPSQLTQTINTVERLLAYSCEHVPRGRDGEVVMDTRGDLCTKFN